MLRVSSVLSVQQFLSSQLHRLATAPQSTEAAVDSPQRRSASLHQRHPRKVAVTLLPPVICLLRDLWAPKPAGAERGSAAVMKILAKERSACAS